MMGASYSVSIVDCVIEGVSSLVFFFRLGLGEGYPQEAGCNYRYFYLYKAIGKNYRYITIGLR